MSLADIQSMKALKTANQNASILRSYTWNTDKGLRNWNIAKAKAANSTPNIIFLGDSITDSTGATIRESGFVGLIRNAIQFSTGLSGHGFVNNNVFVPDGTWTALQEGTNLKTWKATNVSTATSFKDFINKIDVIYATKPDGGTATIKVDGATQGTINCNGANSWHNVATFSFGAGVHQVQIVPAASGNTYIEGVICYSGKNGVLVHQVGHPGIKATDYVNSTDIAASTSAFNPLLTIIMLGTNDAGGQVSIATYQSSLDALTKQALTKGDVLIVSMADRSDSGTFTIPYSSYVIAAKQVAINNNTAYLSIYDRWNKSYAWANTNGLMFDSVHPSQIGHVDIAEAIRSVLDIAFPVYGVWQIQYDQGGGGVPYGDIVMSNAPSSLRISDTLQLGLHGRAFNVPVTTSATSIVINNSQPDSSFGVKVTTSWNTTFWITGKSFAGFTVNFGTAAPSGATIDWEITR